MKQQLTDLFLPCVEGLTGCGEVNWIDIKCRI